MFHCSFGAKSVSLCATMEGDHVGTLGYRYGRSGHVELSQQAANVGNARFHATVAPAAPGASVRQVWFTRGAFTYLLTQCVGGNCPNAAGLAVLRGDKPVLQQRCLRSADDRAWFSPELIQFGRNAETSQSRSAQLFIDDIDNGVERFYPVR